jgi:hypothetical protein
MYKYTFRYADETQGKVAPDYPRPLLPPGYRWVRHEVPLAPLNAMLGLMLRPCGRGSKQAVYFEKDSYGWRWPIAQSVVKDGHLIFFIRGTVFPGAWRANYDCASH